jgi:hypothetical protein
MAKAIQLGSMVYVRYLDHVLYRNIPKPIDEPAERETIGWLTKDEKEIVCIENDRTLDKLPYSSGSGSGLVLLKSCIIEIRLSPIQNVSGWPLIPRNTYFRNAESALQTKKRKIQPK